MEMGGHYTDAQPAHREVVIWCKNMRHKEGVGGIEGLHTPVSPRVEPRSDERGIEARLEQRILAQVLHPRWH